MRPNPIKRVRTNHNMTQRSLAEQAGISPTAVLRYEQGLYEKLSDKINNVLKELDDTQMSKMLPELYVLWREDVQLHAKPYFIPLPNLAVNLNEHPFTTFRRTVTTRAVGKDSRISFCILLAIHPSVVLDYEAGKQEHMPNLIKEALLVAGVPAEYIHSLDQLGGVYYDRRVNSSGR